MRGHDKAARPRRSRAHEGIRAAVTLRGHDGAAEEAQEQELRAGRRWRLGE